LSPISSEPAKLDEGFLGFHTGPAEGLVYIDDDVVTKKRNMMIQKVYITDVAVTKKNDHSMGNGQRSTEPPGTVIGGQIKHDYHRMENRRPTTESRET
jgi:hypothetical protein